MDDKKHLGIPKVTRAINKHLSPEDIKSISPIKIQTGIAEEVKRRRGRAKKLRKEAEEAVKQAKDKVEEMILG